MINHEATRDANAGARDAFILTVTTLLAHKTPDETLTAFCSVLIRQLLLEGWQDENGGIVRRFATSPAVVQAFRNNGIFLVYCGSRSPLTARRCAGEKDHLQGHAGADGETWPQTAGRRTMRGASGSGMWMDEASG